MATKGEDGGLVIGVREPAAQEAAEISVAVRRYGIREDPKTGRLVRVNAGRKVRTVPAARSATVAAGLEGVQVLSSESAGKSPGSVELESLVQEAGRRHDVDPELIRAVMRQESGFNPLAVSRKGAQGLMQLMPETAKRLGVQDVFDPAENVLGGAKLLRQLMDRYQGDLDLALAAYNAGEGAVEKYGGLPPYRETVDYVGRITQAYGLVARADSEAVTQSIVPKPRIRAVEGLDGSLVFETE
ncbi:MAG: transglycosylase SLT domain-containing protein [Acidobacteria bacterium]|nr:transglycosylase SLT domain-containing protein [Acidobacteriota bacterium]